MFGTNCKFNKESDFSRSLIFNVKKALGKEYKFEVFKTVAETFKGDIKDLTLEYVLKNYPRKNLEKQSPSVASEKKNLSAKIQIHQGFWSRKEVDDNPRVLYVFTDNTDRDSGSSRIEDDSWYAKKYGKGHHYPGATTAMIRGKNNARPISTVKWFYKNHPGVTYPKTDRTSRALWHDSDIEEFKKVVRDELEEIVREFNTGNYDTIMFPSGDGLFNADISDISKTRTPELYKALSDLLTEFGFESLVPKDSDSVKTIKEPVQQAKPNARWAVKADKANSIEVSSAGDEFGRQFSALSAVLEEGTTLVVNVGGEKHSINVGGYSIEAAYQLLKGYKRNPKGSLIDKDGNLIKVNGKRISIEGKGKSPISDVLKVVSYKRTALTKEQRENHSYNIAYLPLWKLWAKQNPELIQELKKRAGKEKILTDQYAKKTVVSQARALAEILWGTPKSEIPDFYKEKYAQERQRAIEASKVIPRDVKKKGNVNNGLIKFIDRSKYSDTQIAYLASGMSVNGKVIMEGDQKAKGYLIAFKVPTTGIDTFNPELNWFHNPFEGQKDAIKKFIQWIIPNDYSSLPKELQIPEYEDVRNKLRTYLSKGGYTKRKILTDNNPDNILFAKTLRYIIDNFKALRQRYNPIDIFEFGNLKHNITTVSEDSSNSSADAVFRFIPEEIAQNENANDDNSIKLERYDSTEKGKPDEYVITFPSSFDTLYNKAQKERLIKTLAAATPEGSTVSLNADIASEKLLKAFEGVVKYGYERVASKEVTMEDGSLREVGVYRRQEYINSQVEKRDFYSPDSIKENMEPDTFYILENVKDDQLAEITATIPTEHNNRREADSYLSDEKDFEWFKGWVDRAVERAKEVIDKGGKVVIPKTPMGSTASALYHYAPKCYDYVNSRLQELQDYGNKGEAAQEYMSAAVTTVSAVEGNPAESIDLSVPVLESAKATLYQRFTNIEIKDLSNYYREVFLDVLKNKLVQCKKDLQEKIATEKDKKKKERYQYRLKKLTNPETQYLEVLNEVTMEEMHKSMRKCMEAAIDNAYQGKKAQTKITPEGAGLVDISLNNAGFFKLIFNYSLPLIEDSIGIRITATQNATIAETEAAKRDKMEDPAGDDSPEMGWSYNHRLVDPFKSLTYSIRRMISDIEMRDPNDMRKKLTDSLGRPKKYNSNYIYASVMSRMAKMTLGEIDNFMTITPASKLSGADAKKFPFGKPFFPVLEGMKYQYPWVNDLISKLTANYNVNTIRLQYPGITVEDLLKDNNKMAALGNIASQFYTNFCQTFVTYATMVNGKIIEENKSIGEESLRQAAINNYQGNVRFPGIAMIYNNDGSVDNDNIQKQLDAVRNILHVLYNYNNVGRTENKKSPFWAEISRLQALYNGDSLIDAWENCAKEQKKFISDITNTLKASGLVFSDFDIFCLAMDKKAKAGISEMMSDYEMCLQSIVGLPKNEHIFKSSKYSEFKAGWSKGKMEHTTPRFYWNKFFEKFGDRVTERELVDSTRILGKSRYSYIYNSYMSMTLGNLTNPDLKARKKYIEQNYMPYSWFYDKVTGRFKNKFLEDMYNGKAWTSPSERPYAIGHDMLVKKDGYEETEYQDWSPEDIMQIMFREQDQPTDTSAACYIAPVLSDSQICKAIQAPKVNISQALEGMRSVVLQELERMDLVEKRNIILKMQELQEKMDDGLTLTKPEREYYNQHEDFYNAYEIGHIEKLEEVENYDKNGKKFCFFPELNQYHLSVGIAESTKNQTMMQIIRILSKDPNNPSTNAIGLKDVLKALQVMPNDTFSAKAAWAGLTTTRTEDVPTGEYRQDVEYVYNQRTGRNEPIPKVDDAGNPVMVEIISTQEVQVPITKEEAINRVIDDALNYIMNRKIADFVYREAPKENSVGVINDQLLNAVLREDSSLMSKYNSLPRETDNHHLTAEEKLEVKQFYDEIYNKAATFYWAHTYTMSQFLQLMVTDIAYYKDPDSFLGSVDFGKRFKEVYGAGMKLNTNSKFGKKVERSIILKDRVRRSVSMSTLESVLQKAVDDGRISQVEIDVVLDKFKGIKGTDAQAYRSLTSWRDIMDMIGKNDENLSKAIDNLRNNRWTMSDFYAVFQTIKPFTYGPEDQDSGIDDIRMRTMVQHKNSEAVLLALYNTLVGSSKDDVNYSPRLRGLNRAMEEIELLDEDGNVMTYANGEHMKAIDVAQYHSAVKVGAHGIIDINYSRKKLKKVQEDGNIVIAGKNFKVGDNETYYSIAERLGRAVDAKAISEEDYNKVMDMLEPDEDEVFEIIKNSIYKNPNNFLEGYNNQVLHRVPYAYYSIQQPTPNHYTDNEEGTFGSQPRHIIMAELPEDIKITINGKTYNNRDEIRERYNGLLVANLLDCYEKEIEPLFNDVDKKKTPAQRLRDRIKPIIENNPKYSKTLLDALDTDKDGNFIMPLNNLTVAHQLEEIMTSLFKNAIHRQDINGGNAIIAADEGVGYSKSLRIRGERDENGKLIPGKIEGIECYLPAHAKKMLEPFMVDSNGNAYGTTDPALLEGVERDNYGNIIYKLDPQKLKEAGLDKAIGYRIPTEGLYSIMPLIICGFLPQQSGSSIVLAQEVVELTGSDNDVDKLFLMLKKMRDLKAISAAGGKDTPHPLDMTKDQRDNEIIDIFYAITTHEQMSHIWLSPGNFDHLKFEAQKNKIMKTPYLRNKFMENAGINRNDYEALANLLLNDPFIPCTEFYRKVMQISPDEKLKPKNLLDVVVDFTGRYQRPLSPVYPDTFIKMHQMYMAGVAEKGIYANNTLDHAKLQWADINLAESHEFTFEGRRIKKLDERYIIKTKGNKKYRHYISKDCAECSAASVDNGKDPQLDDINSNKQTATFFGFLLRLGLGLDGAGALMAQPAVDWSIRSTGNINRGILKNEIRSIEAWLKDNGFELSDARFYWQNHNFSVKEWNINTMNGNWNNLQNLGTGQNNMERVVSLYCTYNLILHLMNANQDMQEPRTILHYDSPTNAADTSLGGVVAQTKYVEDVNNRKNNIGGKSIYGEEELVIYNIEKKFEEEKGKKDSNKKVLHNTQEIKEISPKRKLFNAIMSSPLPITQGFYTLGIEKIRKEFKGQFIFGRDELQDLTDVLWEYTKKMGIFRPEQRTKIISQMFKDWVVFRLSATKLFGDDDTMTFDQKRQYYLYQFPGEFMRLKEQIPELNDIEATRNMYVEKGIIMMHRGQKTSTTMRDFITDSFDSLIQSDNKQIQEVAKKLFMYTYYLNGFDFNYTSFGNMMSTQFQAAFPEFIQALREMNSETITAEDMDNFFNQMVVKRNRNGLLPRIHYKNPTARAEGLQRGYHDTGEKYDPDTDIPEYVIDVHITGMNEEKTEVLRLNRNISELHGTIIYEPVRANSALHFNANQTLDEMLDVVYDQELINKNRKVGAYKRNYDSVNYHNYQNSKDMREVSTDRDANVPEPEANGKSRNRNLNNVNVNSSALNDTSKANTTIDTSKLDNDRELDFDKLENSASGNVLNDVDPLDKVRGLENDERFIRNLNKAEVKVPDKDDIDVKEGKDIIKKNNNGKEPCI